MTVELYLSYVIACFVVLAVPGPTILLVISYALAQESARPFPRLSASAWVTPSR